MLDRITPIILTYNEAANISARLRELHWASDIVVLDSYSTDDTAKIVSAFPRARLFQRTFDNHASQWNFALKETSIETDWMLALDADYRMPEEFTDELQGLSSNDGTAGYRARFVYCINGRAINSGVYPPVVVLYQRNLAEYIQDGHTQRLVLKGEIETLRSHLYHDDRKPLAAFFKAQHDYARLEANKILSSSATELSLANRVRRLQIEHLRSIQQTLFQLRRDVREASVAGSIRGRGFSLASVPRETRSCASRCLFRHGHRVAFNQPLTGSENFLVQTRGGIARDADVLDLFQRDAGRAQTIIDRLRRKPRAMLDAIKALFFDGRDQFAVFDERGRRITVERIDAENVQG